LVNYVKSLGKIYQNSSCIARGFEHTGDTMKQVNQSSRSATSRPKTILVKLRRGRRTEPNSNNKFLCNTGQNTSHYMKNFLTWTK